MTDYQYFEPGTIKEAVDLLTRFGTEARILAGGTDLILDVQHHRQQPGTIISINSIKEMTCIEVKDHELHIGAGVTFSRMAASPVINRLCRMLAEGAGCVGSVQIRNVATVGGNICNALPCADSSAPLTAASAEVVLAGQNGMRRIPVVEFIQGPRKTLRLPGELLVEFIIPVKPEGTGSAYKTLTTRKALDLTIAGVAASLTIDPKKGVILNAGLALANSSPRPLRAVEAEALLAEKQLTEALMAQAGQLLADTAQVRDSALRASAEYRRDMLKVLTCHALETAYKRAVVNAREGEEQ